MSYVSYNLQSAKQEFYDFIDLLVLHKLGKKLNEQKSRVKIFAEMFGLENTSAGNAFAKKQLIKVNYSDTAIEAFKAYCINYFKDQNINESKRSDLQSKYNDLMELITPLQSTSTKRSDQTRASIFENVFSKLPDHLIDSKWYVFERHHYGGPEIGRKVLSIGGLIGNMGQEVKLESALASVGPWMGEARYILKENSLAITLIDKESKSNYYHYLIKVETKSHRPTICLGHLTMQNLDRRNIVSKLVVFERIETPEIAVPGTFPLTSLEVDESIRELLMNRRLNRLSSPHKRTVYNLPTLKDWLHQNSSFSGDLYEDIEGEYTVYYWEKVAEQNLVRDGLKLKRLSEHILDAEYTHKIGTGKNIQSLWHGQSYLTMATHTLNTYMLGPLGTKLDLHKTKETNHKPIFLIIDLPSQECKTIDFLVGIASASRDDDKGTVARLIVLRKNPIQFDDYIENLIAKFFDLNRGNIKIRPPHVHKIYDLETLQKAIAFLDNRRGGKSD